MMTALEVHSSGGERPSQAEHDWQGKYTPTRQQRKPGSQRGTGVRDSWWKSSKARDFRPSRKTEPVGKDARHDRRRRRQIKISGRGGRGGRGPGPIRASEKDETGPRRGLNEKEKKAASSKLKKKRPTNAGEDKKIGGKFR